jgi:hypothetical protein
MQRISGRCALRLAGRVEGGPALLRHQQQRNKRLIVAAAARHRRGQNSFAATEQQAAGGRFSSASSCSSSGGGGGGGGFNSSRSGRGGGVRKAVGGGLLGVAWCIWFSWPSSTGRQNALQAMESYVIDMENGNNVPPDVAKVRAAAVGKRLTAKLDSMRTKQRGTMVARAAAAGAVLESGQQCVKRNKQAWPVQVAGLEYSG